MRDWKPIDTAPKDGTAIIAFLQNSNIPYIILFIDGWRICCDGYFLGKYSQPTRWMPLPDAPK